jgi:hypothetical protein
MKSEAAEQVAAPAESSNTQLAPGIHQAHYGVRMEGWRQLIIGGLISIAIVRHGLNGKVLQ